MTLSSIQPSPQILLTSAGRAWNVLSADFIHIPRGRVHVPGGDTHRLGMHFGPPVNADCQCGGRRMRRVQKPGDIDIIPAGVEGSWEDDADCRILRLSFSRSLLDRVAADLGRHGDRVELLPQLQLRDTRLEAIGWAIKADLEADTPSDPLYIDLLANALAVRLIETATGGPQRPEGRSELGAAIAGSDRVHRDPSGQEASSCRPCRGRGLERHAAEDALSQQHRPAGAPICDPPPRRACPCANDHDDDAGERDCGRRRLRPSKPYGFDDAPASGRDAWRDHAARGGNLTEAAKS